MARIIFFIFIFTSSFCTTSCKSEDVVREVELYAHGDIHGKFFSKDYMKGEANASSLSQIYGYVKERRDAIGSNKVVLIDLGDHNHGDNSTYYYNHVYKYGENENHFYSSIANFVDYDAAVIGNHDIEAGREILNKIQHELNFPYLAANIKKNEDFPFDRYTILDKNNLKIAIVGFTTPSAEKWIGEEKKEGLSFIPIHHIAQDLIDEVNEKENPDITIMALHAGTGDGNIENLENPGLYLAKTLKGVHVILTSHDHISYCNNVTSSDSVLIINSGEWGKKLSKIALSVKKSKGKVQKITYQPELIEISELTPDKLFDNYFNAKYNAVKDFSCKQIGSTDLEIIPSEILQGPCTYSNLLHYVQLKETEANISFVSPTKFRGTIKEGKMDYNTVLQLYPFENSLYTVSLTGAQILKYLEICYSGYDKYGQFKGSPVKFDCAGGLRYSVDCKKPSGHRITIHSFINGKEFSLTDTYKVAMVSYRANGGGDILCDATGYPVNKLEELIISKHSDVRELIYQFFLSGKKVSQTQDIADWKLITEYSAL